VERVPGSARSRCIDRAAPLPPARRYRREESAVNARASSVPDRWAILTAAPHRVAFLSGLFALLGASAWWGLHLLARYAGKPLFALDLVVAPVWAHSFLMLLATFPAFMVGFLFTTFPRWMNGRPVARRTYVAAPLVLAISSAIWLVGIHVNAGLAVAAAAVNAVGLLVATSALLRVMLDAEQIVPHAIVASAAFAIGGICSAGFGYGLWTGSDFALHFAVRTALWGFLLPVFFAVCHRMIPFFSQGVLTGYRPWRPAWMLTAVVGLAWLRLLLGTTGALSLLVVADAALFVLTALCAVRWTSLASRGKPLLWTLYAGYAWLPLAMLLQTLRDGSFVMSGEWALGRAPIHALGMGFFGSLLLAMVTRVTMGHSGRMLTMNRMTLSCFLVVQAAALARVSSEIVGAPGLVRWLLLGSVAAWLAAYAVWGAATAPIYLTPRIDGRPG